MQTSSSSLPRQTPSGEQNRTYTSRMRKLWQSRWLVLVASLWLQACAGVAYAFGGYSSLVKSTLGYSQQQITILGIAKDFGVSIGLIAGFLSGILPTWSLIALGTLHNLLGYGWLWLIITGHSPILPMWAVCILILIGTSGETYWNTVTLVTNVSNFPNSRGHVSGLLKGFNGLCSAIFAQIYITFFAPDESAYLLIIALGPTVVSLLMMFIIRRIKSKEEGKLSDAIGFSFIYGDSLVMAAYLMGVLILQDVMTVSFNVRLMFTILLLVMVGLPAVTPMVLWVAEDRRRRKKVVQEMEGSTMDMEEKEREVPLMRGCKGEEKAVREEEKALQSHDLYKEGQGEMVFTSTDVYNKGQAEMVFTSKDANEMDILLAAAEGAATVKEKKGPRRGEDFTPGQALLKADFWLLFLATMCGTGTGMAAIDNMGQISESQGYSNPSVFVSMTSIFNFLGRLLGGYCSEILVRHYVLPRSWAICVAQGIMGVGHFLIAMGWANTLYVGALLVGTSYGSLWGIVPPMISELFGIKSFGMLYNFYTMATPLGVLFFSGFLVGYLYDIEASKQNTFNMVPMVVSITTSCFGEICFRLSFLVMIGVCVVGILLAAILSVRTRSVYMSLYDNKSPQTSKI